MSLYLIGIDYKNAPIDVRESIYGARKEMGPLVFATCNRVEVYAQAADEVGRKFPAFLKYGYIKNGEKEVLKHILRLAVGLESQLKGELQILSQLDAWRKNNALPRETANLFEKAIQAARYIRLEAGLNDAGTNIAAITLDDIIRNVDHDRRIELAVVGTGKVAQLFAAHHRPEARVTFLANKNYATAERLATESGGAASRLRDLKEVFINADAIVSATSSPHFVIRKKEIAEVASGRGRPLYIYDLAVPRDVDPGILELPGVILKNSEALAGIFEEYNNRISQKIALAEYLVEEILRWEEADINAKYIKDRHAA